MRSLLRYKRHYKLIVRPQASKFELIHAVRKHFARAPKPRLHETEVLAAFLQANHRALVERETVKQQAKDKRAAET